MLFPNQMQHYLGLKLNWVLVTSMTGKKNNSHKHKIFKINAPKGEKTTKNVTFKCNRQNYKPLPCNRSTTC